MYIYIYGTCIYCYVYTLHSSESVCVCECVCVCVCVWMLLRCGGVSTFHSPFHCQLVCYVPGLSVLFSFFCTQNIPFVLGFPTGCSHMVNRRTWFPSELVQEKRALLTSCLFGNENKKASNCQALTQHA